MTTQLLITEPPQFLFIETAEEIGTIPSASVISDDPLDIEYLHDQISNYFPSTSFTTEHYADFSTMMSSPLAAEHRVVVARIVKDGFFDFLKHADPGSVTVIALVDGTQEEIQAARFIGVKYVSKAELAVSSAIHHLFCNPKAFV
ncbi:hypothetical protein LZZ85_03240 [Terrimonas sp. NA20]|uniref:Uncharacterized protein n=1 Tax=Terrimonas ginsenosidimutans TaxID=2908004 RepID=A0ABS9KLR8_9BACT|nr:hypothetical protein [Terrimonas ginsenosidimutans]MCG2613273.1 hypothetical protein [Terrimonas ginsenosidimutans]